MWAFPMQRNGSGAAGALAKLEDVAVGPGGTIVYFVTKDLLRGAQARREEAAAASFAT